MDKLDAQIAQLEQKLAVERKVRAGAEGMRLVITDKKALAQMELSLSDSQKRLDFLEGELGKVVAKKRQLSMSLGALNQVGGSSVSEGAGPCHKHRATGGVDGSTRRIANIDGADARSNDEDGVGAYFRDESGAVTPPRLCGANVEDVMELSTSASLPPRLSPPTTAMVKVRVDSPTPKPRSSSIGVIPATDDISARADSMATFTSTTARQSSARGPCLCPMDATVHIDGCPKHVAASPAAPPKSVGGFFRAFGRKSSSATSLDGSAVAPPSSSSSTPNQHLSPPSLRGKALADVPRKNSKGSLSNLDLSKSSTELSAEKIAVKIIELRSKIEIESRVKAGAEKLLEALEAKAEPSEKDRENKERVYWKMRVAGEKVGLLKTALVRYQGMHVDGLADIGELERLREQSRTPVSGKLKVNIVSVQNLILGRGANGQSKQDLFVDIRVDNGDAICRKARSSKTLVWNESVEVQLEKAHEIEFVVRGADFRQFAVLFFRLCDIETEIREQQAADMNNAHTIESVWDMEPAGQIKMGLRLVTKTQNPRRPDRLQRHAGVRRRKHYVVNGHKFEAQRSYQFMKCALCSDHLIAGVGYRCESCGYFCHRKCHEKVVTKCISRADDVEELNNEQAKLLRHNVHHRFEPALNLTPNWCCHCGYMLPMGKKGAEKCQDCNIMCHCDCSVYVPNLCGMSTDVANRILFEAQEVEKRRKAGLLSPAAIISPKNRKIATTKEAPDGTPALQAQVKETHATSPDKHDEVVTAQKTKLSDPASPATVTIPRLDHFNFLAVLGKGNFGKVMLAEEKSTRQLFAIKVLKKDFIVQNDEIESMRSEKRVFLAVNSQRHPFLVGLHSCFQTETRVYFVMEYVNGGDLMLHIQRQQFSEKRARFYACEVLLALEFFHKRNILYRDLKLDNILLTRDGHVKLADYGLCKENMAPGDGTNTFCGTPEFMAPEILLEKEYDRAVDWWAFGVLIYEMLLGQAPFKGGDEDEIFDSILHSPVTFPRDTNRDAVSIVQQLLSKDPVKRLGSGPGDAEDVKSHPYFRGINWDDVLHKRIEPPFVPQVKHSKDVSNFDTEFTAELPVLTPVQSTLLAADQDEFRQFSYAAGMDFGGMQR